MFTIILSGAQIPNDSSLGRIDATIVGACINPILANIAYIKLIALNVGFIANEINTRNLKTNYQYWSIQSVHVVRCFHYTVSFESVGQLLGWSHSPVELTKVLRSRRSHWDKSRSVRQLFRSRGCVSQGQNTKWPKRHLATKFTWRLVFWPFCILAL